MKKAIIYIITGIVLAIFVVIPLFKFLLGYLLALTSLASVFAVLLIPIVIVVLIVVLIVKLFGEGKKK